MSETSISITYQQAMHLIQSCPDCAIIDLRRKEDYLEGHILHAISLPYEDFTLRFWNLFPVSDSVLLFYCYHGQCARAVVNLLRACQYRNSYSIGSFAHWPGKTCYGNHPHSMA